MSLLDYFRISRRNSAAIAKERLQILVAHERAERNRPSYLPMMQKELLEVVQKYVDVDQNAITINVEKDDRHEILELNILLPEDQPQPRKVGRG
jgi:cell division topological specificity factor